MTEQTLKKSGVPVTLIVGAVLLVVGIIGLVMQYSEGLTVLNDYPFGLYLAAFFTFAGGACGLMMAAAASEFGLFRGFGSTRPLFIGALALLITCGCTITFLDCGQPLRVFSMIIGASPTSMVTWDFYFLLATAIASVVGIVKPGRIVAIVGSMLALGIIVVEAMILIVTSGVVHWNNPVIVVLFLIDAITLGSSLLLFARGAFDGRVRFALAAALTLTLVMLLADVASGLYTDDAATATLVYGPFAPMFWIMLVGCVAAPLVMTVAGSSSAVWWKVAGCLSIAGVFLDKLTLLLAGQAVVLTTGDIAAHAFSLTEVLCTAGALGLAIVLANGSIWLMGRSAASQAAVGGEKAMFRS